MTVIHPNQVGFHEDTGDDKLPKSGVSQHWSNLEGVELLAVVLSMAMTSIGTFPMWKGTVAPGWVFPASIITGAIIAAFYTTYLNRIALNPPKKKAWALLGFAAIALIDVPTNFAFSERLFKVMNVQFNREAMAVRDGLIDKVELFKLEIKQTTSSLMELEKYSRTMAEIEKREGFTCEAIGAGAGPRMDLRLDDASQLSGIKKNAVLLETEVNGLSDSIYSQLTTGTFEYEKAQPVLIAFTSQINAMKRDIGLQRAKQWLEKRVKQGAQGWQTTTGMAYCNDARFDELANTAIERITSLALLPNLEAPNRASPDDEAMSIAEVIDKLSGAVPMQRLDFWALTLAALPLILMLTMSLSRDVRVGGQR